MKGVVCDLVHGRGSDSLAEPPVVHGFFMLKNLKDPEAVVKHSSLCARETSKILRRWSRDGSPRHLLLVLTDTLAIREKKLPVRRKIFRVKLS